MNPGGDPDRDDFGLPPLDIEIPDDARELDRDVQAYHREQRALRRHRRRQRWAGPLARDGMVLPLLAGCLVLALIAGTLLTVFTAVPGDLTNGPRPRPRGTGAELTTQPGSKARVGPAPTAVTAITGARSQLPPGSIEVRTRSVQLRKLKDLVLALVPHGCQCAAAVRQLIDQAAQTKVQVLLVGTDAAMPDVRRLAEFSGAPGTTVADDKRNVLGVYQPRGLTALLVDAHGSVKRARELRPELHLTGALRDLDRASTPAP